MQYHSLSYPASALFAGALITCAGIFNTHADMTINVASQKVDVTGSWTEPGKVTFIGRVNPWTSTVLNFGLHFVNGVNNSISNDFVPGTGISDSPLVGVDAANTVVTYNGYFKGQTGGASQSKASLTLTKGGKFILGPSSTFDFLEPTTWYTRQLWVYGDGTGTMECDVNFVADKTANGTTPLGIGSYRLSNTRLITRHTKNLPVTFRPDTGGTLKVNGHFVFENAAGSRWIVTQNPQTYNGGVWIAVNMTLETQTDLTTTGVTTTWTRDGGYTNHGGFQTTASNVTITKEGVANLNLNGEQAYNPGAVMVINNGTVNFNSDPAAGTPKAGTNGQHLTINVNNSAKANFGATLVRILGLTIRNSGSVSIASGKDLNVSNPVSLQGGSFTGSGKLSGSLTNSAGQVSPGTATAGGTLTITGNYIQQSTGTLDITLFGKTSGQFDVLAVNGTANLAGTLKVNVSGITLAANDQFDVLNWGTRTGTFGTLSLPVLGSGLSWDTSNLYTTGVIKVVGSSNPAPTVSLTSPANGATFNAPASISLQASATDSNGTISKVEFLSGSTVLSADTTSPYATTWSNVAAGAYALTARATDNGGATSTSTAVNVTVSNTGSGGSTTLNPTADSYVRDGTYASSNFGTSTILDVKTETSSYNRHAYFKFDLAGVSSVSSAKLRIYAALSATGSVGTSAYSVADTTWTESGITWNNKPVSGSTALSSATVTTTAYAWYELDVTSYVAAEKSAGRNVVSIALKNPSSTTPKIGINSREASVNKPQLVIQ